MESKTLISRQKRRQRGTTLLEVLLTTIILSVVVGVGAQALLTAGQVGVRVRMRSEMQQNARNHLELLSQDVQAADSVLATAPAAVPRVCGTGSATCTSSSNNTLVLRLPSLDANGDIKSNSYDYVAYHLVATSGDNGPYTLNRVCVLDASGSSRRAMVDTVLARNVSGIGFRYATQKTFTGTGTLLSFVIGALSTPDTLANSQTVVYGTEAQVLVNGTTPVVAPRFVAGALVFITAPPLDSVIDAICPINPANGTDGVAMVGVTLQMEPPASATVGTGSSTGLAFTLQTLAELRNR